MSYYSLLMRSVSATAMTANIIRGDITFKTQTLYGVMGIPLYYDQIRTVEQTVYASLFSLFRANEIRIKDQSLYVVRTS